MNPEEANLEAGSQPAATGATEASPTSTTTTADPSPAGAKAPESIAEALEEVKLEQPAEEAAGTQAGEGSQSEQPPATGAGSDQAGTDEAVPTDGQTAKPTPAADDLDAPFHTRKEWQEAVKLGGDKIKPVIRELLKSETRAREVATQLKPLADQATELRELTGGEAEFNTMRQLVRAYAAGDPAVLPILKQMVQTVEKISGEVITSPDLVQREANIRQQLNDGLIDQAEYNTQAGLLKEIERNRAGKRTAETQLKQTTTTVQQQEVARQQEAMISSINSWESNIRQRDPDFGNVTDVNDPKHGETVADQVFDAMALKRMSNPNATTDDLIAAAQRAYTLARGRNGGTTQRQQRVVTSQSSSITGRQKPRTMREAMDAVRLD